MLFPVIYLFCSFLINLLVVPFCNICYDTLLGLRVSFIVSIDNFEHVLYTVLLLPSLTGPDKCTWLGPFE